MFGSALFDPVSLLVVAVITAMAVLALAWYVSGQRQFHALVGGLRVLRRVGLDLHRDHPVRKRIESAPVVELSFEEIAKLMTGQQEVEPAAHALIRLRERLGWIERFSQYATHLGILGTVFAIVSSDPSDLESFRRSLPLALGTTFWGLIGALLLSTVAGAAESVLERANQVVRNALLDALDEPAAAAAAAAPARRAAAGASPAAVAARDSLVLDAPSSLGYDEYERVVPRRSAPGSATEVEDEYDDEYEDEDDDFGTDPGEPGVVAGKPRRDGEG